MSRRKYSYSQVLAGVGAAILSWATPQQQLKRLEDNPGRDYVEWENFRDTMCRKWVNLNVICGLILGAVATILFSKYPLRPAAFTLAAASILSGLTATGIGVSLTYVLGDLKGLQYKSLMQRHPVLFAFVLVLPQMWAFICFATFYFSCAVALWDAVNKSWMVKAGVGISAFVITLHLVGFIYAFHLLGDMPQRPSRQDRAEASEMFHHQETPNDITIHLENKQAQEGMSLVIDHDGGTLQATSPRVP